MKDFKSHYLNKFAKPLKLRKYSPNLGLRKKQGIKLEKPDVHFKTAKVNVPLLKSVGLSDNLIGSLFAGGLLGGGAGALYTAIKDRYDDDPYNDYYPDRKRWIKNILRGAGVGALLTGGYNTYDNIRKNNIVNEFNKKILGEV